MFSPSGTRPNKYSQDFLEKTIRVWQPYSPTPLSLEDARDIADNMTGLFKLLSELDKKYAPDLAEMALNEFAGRLT